MLVTCAEENAKSNLSPQSLLCWPHEKLNIKVLLKAISRHYSTYFFFFLEFIFLVFFFYFKIISFFSNIQNHQVILHFSIMLMLFVWKILRFNFHTFSDKVTGNCLGVISRILIRKRVAKLLKALARALSSLLLLCVLSKHFSVKSEKEMTFPFNVLECVLLVCVFANCVLVIQTPSALGFLCDEIKNQIGIVNGFSNESIYTLTHKAPQLDDNIYKTAVCMQWKCWWQTVKINTHIHMCTTPSTVIRTKQIFRFILKMRVNVSLWITADKKREEGREGEKKMSRKSKNICNFTVIRKMLRWIFSKYMDVESLIRIDSKSIVIIDIKMKSIWCVGWQSPNVTFQFGIFQGTVQVAVRTQNRFIFRFNQMTSI